MMIFTRLELKNFKSHADTTLDFNPGISLIVGENGAGKSTLVNLVMRLYDAVDGEVLVDGVPVKDYDLAALRKKISFVMQKSELFSGTISENVRIGKDDATDDEVREAVAMAEAKTNYEEKHDKATFIKNIISDNIITCLFN